jgi:hypothetical protein
MEKEILNPVELSTRAFGGVRKLARAIDRDPAAVSRWKKSGTIPSAAQRRLLEKAWELGLDLTAHDLIFGRQDG